MLLNKYNNFFLKVERKNRCRNPDKTKGLGFLWHKALNKDIAEILVAQPIYPLMVYRLLHAKVALAASSWIVGQAVQKNFPKKGNSRRLRNCLKIFQTEKKNLIPKLKSSIGRKWKEWINLDLFEKKGLKKGKITQ